jgi:hypothetical protein
MTKKFHLKFAIFKPDTQYSRLDFTVQTPEREFVDAVIADACGAQMDYGKLFAYLFRRFGYPNAGWDDYKELAKYYLTTPHPDLILRIVPYAGGDTKITFSFIAPLEVGRAADAYEHRFRQAWRSRFVAYVRQQPEPEWAAEWLAFCNDELPHYWGAQPPSESFVETLKWMNVLRTSTCERHTSITARAEAFRKQLEADYEAIEPVAAVEERSQNWREWHADDPLKPFAEAASCALQDLRRPVGIRDIAINAYGTTNFGRGYANPAPVAGYPSGNLGNAAPAEFAALHSTIMEMGRGDARRGIKKAQALLAASLPQNEGSS